MIATDLWTAAAAFHGHECPGLAMGMKLAEASIIELGIDASELPLPAGRMHVVNENDTCPRDAFRYLMGVDYDDGSLEAHLTDDLAFTVTDKTTGRSVRVSLRPGAGHGLDRAAKQAFILGSDYHDVVDVVVPG